MSRKGNATPDQGGAELQPRAKYPNSFLFGVFSGVFLNMATRTATHEPLHARPFSYIQTGLSLGIVIWYYDYWRRRAIEQVMYGEENARYHQTLRAINQVRVGEEEEISNLVEYLTNSTVRD